MREFSLMPLIELTPQTTSNTVLKSDDSKKTKLYLDEENKCIWYSLDLSFTEQIDLSELTKSEEVQNEDFSIRKKEDGVIHISDIYGIYKSSTPVIIVKEDNAITEYQHEITILGGEKITFSCSFKELKEAYNKLSEFYIKTKNR